MKNLWIDEKNQISEEAENTFRHNYPDLRTRNLSRLSLNFMQLNDRELHHLSYERKLEYRHVSFRICSLVVYLKDRDRQKWTFHRY